MYNGNHFYPGTDPPPLEYQGGSGNYMQFPGGSSYHPDLPFGANRYHGIEFQSSEVCPKNFIIFDQTDHRSQVMYNPSISHKFNGGGPAFNTGGAYYPQGNFAGGYRNNYEGGAVSSTLKEDSDDINALLSMEGEEEQDCDEEELSTARTYGNYGSSSPESCSNYAKKPGKNRSSSSSKQRSSNGANSNCNDETKRRKMKKMMKALRGMVPGGNDMNTATVLDEAVQYLKSLKVEVQKLGVGNLDD